ncbi:hypothetical protein RJT34_01910 [Clitoria ternatea]|uniref:Uncharacterized protein n=1 Tax=Clitoria ternatea TaxID=43366 RepID=A0AAN9KI44_CLITE
MTSEGGKKVTRTIKEAKQFVEKLKDIFHDEEEKLNEFLKAMREFKTHGNVVAVRTKAKEILDGMEFNNFLPMGYEIPLPPEEEQPPQKTYCKIEDAMNFVANVKARFQNNDHVYKSFLGILTRFRNGHVTVIEVYEQVTTLLEAHPDLIQEFTYFLPSDLNA